MILVEILRTIVQIPTLLPALVKKDLQCEKGKRSLPRSR